MAASIIEVDTLACTCAFGSHMWTGTVGTLLAIPRAIKNQTRFKVLESYCCVKTKFKVVKLVVPNIDNNHTIATNKHKLPKNVYVHSSLLARRRSVDAPN
jgi:hypothetical protein